MLDTLKDAWAGLAHNDVSTMPGVRRRLVRDLRHVSPPLSRSARWAKIDSLSDDQLCRAISNVHAAKCGQYLAIPPSGGIGDWLSRIGRWIKDNWVDILKTVCAVIGLVILL
jgi:hypothetical protein